MHRIDYATIANQKSGDARLEAIEEEIKKCGDYVCLTDALTHQEMYGPLVLVWLQDDEKNNARYNTAKKFRLRVLRNEWGIAPPELTFVERVEKKPPKSKFGRNLTTRQLNDMRRRGTYDRDMIVLRKFEIDEKGCIECGYEDAGYFLSEYGIHFETSAAISGHREISSGVCRAPDGSMKHVWYWRFSECPPEVYEKLPTLRKPAKTKVTETTKFEV